MRAARLTRHGGSPEIGEMAEPAAGQGQAVVEIEAAAVHPVDFAIADGTYDIGARPPFVLGREGVGRLAGGRRVWFDGAVPPYGAFAARALVDEARLVELPEEPDAATCVCLGIAGLAAWLALEDRAALRDGERVLVLGAGGAVGTIAIQAARLLGAGTVVAAARRPESLRRARELGADATVDLGGDPRALAAAILEASGGGVDVVVDPLWGDTAAAVVAALRPFGRLVQLGESGGARTSLPAEPIRNGSLGVLGYTIDTIPLGRKAAALRRMAEHAARGDLRVDYELVPLDDLPSRWGRAAATRLVVVPG
jgi:NADPH:quinone reductase-like Zn-dependent oxidoreductase